MSGWKAKRFWKTVSVVEGPEGFGLNLDARPMRTPGKQLLIVPTPAMADAIAAEWRAVDKIVDPGIMPVTRAANSAIDKVTPQFHEVADLIAAYGASDLLCYRAPAPAELFSAQAAAWDPFLAWAAQTLKIRLNVTQGITPIDQPAASLRAVAARVQACSPFQLTALHDLVSISGSFILGLAATHPQFDPDSLWRVSRFEEDWQARLWGHDEDASAIAEIKRLDFMAAHRFWQLSSAKPE